MSDSNQTSTRKLSRRSTAIIGLVVVFLLVLLISFLSGKINARADLTEYDIYTLSEGTKNILQDLEAPVTVRYYVTDDRDVMSPGERARAQRVEDMLDEFVRAAPVREVEIAAEESGEFETKKQKLLQVEKLNPRPNTDAEDSAMMDDLQAGTSRQTNNQIYFGIAVESADTKETIPFIPARPGTMLEYDLARAISNVHGGKDEKIAIMTSMSVGGGMGGGFQSPPSRPWAFHQQLSKDYEVETIPSTSAEIPDDIATLVVLHPYDITPEAQFAIDQYLLGGGDVIAFVDPNFFYARALQQQQRQRQRPGMPPQGGGGPAPTSNLDELLKSWGVKYDPNRVLADMDYGSEIMRRGNFSPTFLTLDGSALEEAGNTDPLTRMIDHLNMLTPGAFEIEAPPGIEVARLVETSQANQLVSAADADPTNQGGADRIRRNFDAHGQRRTLVARLSGSFETAFPEGNPAASVPATETQAGGAGAVPGQKGGGAPATEGESKPSGDEPKKSADETKKKAPAEDRQKPAGKDQEKPADEKQGKAPGKEPEKSSGEKRDDASQRDRQKSTDEGGKKSAGKDREKPSDSAPNLPDDKPQKDDPAKDEKSPSSGPASADETGGQKQENAPETESKGAENTSAGHAKEGSSTPEAQSKEDTVLKEAKSPGRVLLFSDVDFIYDANVVRRNQIPGMNVSIPEPLNENLTLVQNAVEQMAGDPNLIDVRSRTSVRRPFTRQNEWLREARQQYADELESFRQRRQETEQRLSTLLSQTPENVDEAMLSPEVQGELEKLEDQEVEFRRKERELEKKVTRTFRRKMALYKFGNALLMPVVVILFGIVLAIVRKTKTAAR